MFTSIPFIQLPIAAVTSDFLQFQGDWGVSHASHFDVLQEGQKASILDLRGKASGFEYMTNIDCVKAYIDPLNATAELILVANGTSFDNAGSSFVDGWIMGDRPTFGTPRAPGSATRIIPTRRYTGVCWILRRRSRIAGRSISLTWNLRSMFLSTIVLWGTRRTLDLGVDFIIVLFL